MKNCFKLSVIGALVFSAPALATTIGTGTETAINIGKGSVVSSVSNGVAIGNGASANGSNVVAIGNTSAASNYNSVAIGNGTSATGAFNSIAIGNSASSTSDYGGIAVGGNSRVSGNYALAVGENATSTGDLSVAIGGDFDPVRAASASGGGTAIGTGARADKGIAIGSGSRAIRADQVDIGDRQITGLKDGTRLTDAATVGQMNAADTATLNNAHAYTDAAKADAVKQANQHSDANLATGKGYTDTQVTASNARTDGLIQTEQTARAKEDADTLDQREHPNKKLRFRAIAGLNDPAATTFVIKTHANRNNREYCFENGF
ncbi:hypothetical protein EFY76_25070 [Salmonella enterica]|uniref:Trimeric autotransporter adhesin YadA-like head domain-containing protein n=1 Tax=Salmonella enterica TaxID=28901 RepID=A0A5T2ME34_SALER|nr:hypothetical protein [Salmonella enterica]